ncbi:MAG: DNA replication/repair protein RecF [Actinomycetota bacterium]
MWLQRLWLTDYRSYTEAELELPPGLTAVQGVNGAGKTNLLEAVAYLATMGSFRGAPLDALVRSGADTAIVRAEVDADGRALLIEAEIGGRGGSRVQVNRQRLQRSRDLLGALRVSVFSPDDVELIKGGPSGRRRFLDEAVVADQPRLDQLRLDVERILRQRGALLRQAGGRLSDDIGFTLDVWDDKLSTAGEQLAAARRSLLERLEPEIDRAHRDLVGDDGATVELTYEASWGGPLSEALATGRDDDVRRRATLRGPHRDELGVRLAGLPARTHASQGEQRSLALAMRLGVHRLLTDRLDQAPVLLLDDVFSELDPDRSSALLAHLPPGQGLVTTAGPLPAAATPERVVRVDDGKLITEV